MSPITLSRGPNVSRDLALGRTRLVSGLRAGTRGRRTLLDSSMTSSTTMIIPMTSTTRTSLIRSTPHTTMGHTRLVHARTGECYDTAGQPRAFAFSADGKRRPTVRTGVIADGAGATSGTVTQQVSDEKSRLEDPNLPTLESSRESSQKKRILVLGAGWGAMSFVRAWDPSLNDRYELVVVSPRNYFVYTPLLPAMCAGTVEERSIVEPVRSVLGGKGRFYEAKCTEIDPQERTIVACFPEDAGFPEACFKIPYDILILGVGCINNTFGIQGVAEHTMFFKSVEDAAKLRLRVSECFERAALPQTTSEERRQLLSFVIVGGGPTGVEVAAELHDLINDDLRKLYPNEVPDVTIRIIELMDHVLSTYDRAISNYTAETFKRNGIELVLNSRVQAVGPDTVTTVDREGNTKEIPYGACVWATGIAMHPLIKQLQEVLPQSTQTHFRSIVTDEYLRVRGAPLNTMFALGDAATIEQQKALDKADELFERADTDQNGRLTMAQLRSILKEASKDFPHLEEHARFLENKYGGVSRFGGIVFKAFRAAQKSQKKASGSSSSSSNSNGKYDPMYEGIDEGSTLDQEQFRELLKTIDSGLRALPATAQVARQEGEYLAGLFAAAELGSETSPSTSESTGDGLAKQGVPGFEYYHKGSLAYVGSDRAVMDVPVVGPIMGLFAGLAWRGFETWSQISLRNQILVANDWARTKVFGRDTSRV